MRILVGPSCEFAGSLRSLPPLLCATAGWKFEYRLWLSSIAFLIGPAQPLLVIGEGFLMGGASAVLRTTPAPLESPP